MTLDGACHCGTVRLSVTLTDGLETIRRCDCSFCTMRGAVAVSADLADITITAGADNLTRYTFHTHAAQHFFCKTCGIYTHHQRRSNPHQYGVNLACLSGQTPFLPKVRVMDGTSHPTDTGGPRVAGQLRYTPTEDHP